MDTGRITAREELMREAERLFGSRGVEAVSLRDIVRAAGHRNESAVQYHFGSKRNLVDAVVAARLQSIEARRVAMLAKIEADGATGDAERLMAAFVEPLADEALSAPGGEDYIRFLAQAITRPGHGKFAVAGYAMGSGDAHAPLTRVVAGAGLAHIAGAALILLLAAIPALAAGGTLPVENWTRPIQGVTYSVLAVIGLWLIVRAVRGGHNHAHAHSHEHAVHRHPASQWTLGAVIGAPPCTGSIIAAAFAIGHQAIALGFAMIIAIAAGMAATLGGVGWTARALRGAAVARASNNIELWWRAFEALGGGLLLLTGGIFAYASF